MSSGVKTLQHFETVLCRKKFIDQTIIMHCKFTISYQQLSPLVEGDEQLHRPCEKFNFRTDARTRLTNSELMYTRLAN